MLNEAVQHQPPFHHLSCSDQQAQAVCRCSRVSSNVPNCHNYLIGNTGARCRNRRARIQETHGPPLQPRRIHRLSLSLIPSTTIGTTRMIAHSALKTGVLRWHDGIMPFRDVCWPELISAYAFEALTLDDAPNGQRRRGGCFLWVLFVVGSHLTVAAACYHGRRRCTRSLQILGAVPSPQSDCGCRL